MISKTRVKAKDEHVSFSPTKLKPFGLKLQELAPERNLKEQEVTSSRSREQHPIDKVSR